MGFWNFKTSPPVEVCLHDSAESDPPTVTRPSGTHIPSFQRSCQLSGSVNKIMEAGYIEKPNYQIRDDHVNYDHLAEGEICTAAQKSNLSQVSQLNDVSDLPAIKGEAMAVTASLKGKCLVIDHGMTFASVVALPEAYENSAFVGLSKALANMNRKVSQYVVGPALFAQLDDQIRLISQKKQVRFAHIEHGGTQLYEELVTRAFQLKATDLHFYITDPQQLGTTSHVRLRVGGRMRTWVSFDTQVLLGALSSAYGSKSTAGTNSQSDYSVSRPTSTMTKHLIKDAKGQLKTISTRFNSRPTVNGGAKATARLLETDVINVKIPSLLDLGFEASQIAMLDLALRRNQGLILLIGGTGGGKSTTLRTMMMRLPKLEELELYTVEDPVEYYLPGFANQLSIARASDENEALFRAKLMSAMRDFLRQDPDVAMIGETRDAEMALLVTEIVNTGHRALTSLHGNGVVDGLDRLTSKALQMQPTTLANEKFLSVCVFQKLLPLLCKHCKQPARDHLPTELLHTITHKFKLEINSMYVASQDGCPHCKVEELGIFGTSGLTVTAEVMVPDRTLREYIKALDWNAATDYWRSQRRAGFADPDMLGKTAFEHALFKAACGLISVVDIETDFEPLATYPIHGDAVGNQS